MPTIRLAHPADLPGAYRVGLRTGDAGRDGTGLFRNPDLIGHVYVGPYIVGEPEFALILASPDGVDGYCLAAPDTRAFEAWCEASWWPLLRSQYPRTGDTTPDAELVGLIHDPELAPDDIVATHPAHLHIDLLEHARGQGAGRALIERQLQALRERAIPGVHLMVAAENVNAIGFYERLGFERLRVGVGAIVMGRRLP